MSEKALPQALVLAGSCEPFPDLAYHGAEIVEAQIGEFLSLNVSQGNSPGFKSRA
jgi:hypothetical protein